MCLGNFTLSTWTSQCLRSCLHGLCTFSSAGNLMLYIFSNLILNVLTYLVPLSIALKISYSPVWHISTNIVERIHWDKNMFVLLSEWSICCKKKKRVISGHHLSLCSFSVYVYQNLDYFFFRFRLNHIQMNFLKTQITLYGNKSLGVGDSYPLGEKYFCHFILMYNHLKRIPY